jgi:tetratricopeptide (TPR) repeat protein
LQPDVNMKGSILVYLLILTFFSCNRIEKTEGITNSVSGNDISDTSAIKGLQEKGLSFFKSGVYDSAIYFYNKAIALSEKTPDRYGIKKIYSELSDVFIASKNYPLALDYSFRILSRLDDEKLKSKADTSLIISSYPYIYHQIGLCYYNIENTDMALLYFNKGLDAAERALGVMSRDKYLDTKMVNLLNIGSVYTHKKQFSKARIYFEKALDINHSLNNRLYYGALYNNLGIIYKEQKDYDKSFEYYTRALEIRTSLKDTAGMAQVLNNIGQYYMWSKKNEKAIECLIRSKELSRAIGNIRSEMFSNEFLAATYEQSGRFKEAFEAQYLYQQLRDSIINSDQAAKAGKLEVMYQYEKQKRESQLQQQLELGRRERMILITAIIAAVSLLLFIIAILLIRNQRIKFRQAELYRKSLELESRNLTLEKQNLLLEKGNLEMELDFKKKELATQVIYLVRKNEFMASVIRKILELKSSVDPESMSSLQSIVREMKSNIDAKVWDEFEVRFQQVHKEFYDKLNNLYPDLTPNEVKLCAFLRLNMSTKDISAITYQTNKSIQVARTRLRKKINIDHDENLVSYLRQL